jgi:polysaccharide biosynthesis/export protein
MNKIAFGILIILLLSFISCVPTRDLTYLQNKGKVTVMQGVNAVALKPYRMQTNDIINVSIKAIDPKEVEIFNNVDSNRAQTQTDESLYFNGYTVDDHGNIRLPILREVNVLGLTAEEVRLRIETRLLEEYFKDEAAIFVNVKLAGFRYTINGEVTTPGSKILMQEKVNMLEAIANAGDITVTGNRKEIALIRQYPHGTEIHHLDLTDVSALQSPYFYLQPNDYVYVKPLPQKAWGTGTTGLQSLTTVVSVLTLVTTAAILLTR